MTEPGADELTELAIDTQLSNVWEMIGGLRLDDDALQLVAVACRQAYVSGYHDGDKVINFAEVSGDFDNAEIDLRVVHAWADVVDSGLVAGERMELVVDLLRCSYCRGFLDGTDTRPFGRAPADPNVLHLPA